MNASIIIGSHHSVAQRRYKSSTVSTTFLTKKQEQSFQKAWLSDPSTFPMIAIMGGAAALVVGVGASCILFNPEYVPLLLSKEFFRLQTIPQSSSNLGFDSLFSVQISPSRRGAVVRHWEM
jgi:hypothetical protein